MSNQPRTQPSRYGEPVIEIPVRRPRRSVALAFLGALLLLVAAELLLRVTLTAPGLFGRDAFQPDWRVRWRLQPNYEYPAFVWNGKETPLRYRTNSRGLKGTRDYPAPRKPGELRVFCVGDSNTVQLHFPGYPEYLQELLEKVFPGRPIWVQNGGMTGYSTEQAKRLAAIELPLFDPDITIVHLGSNDAMRSNHEDVAEFQIGNIGDIIAHLSQRSWLVTYVRKAIPRQFVRDLWASGGVDNITKGIPAQGAGTEKYQLRRVPVADTGKNLRELFRTAKANSDLVLGTLPPWVFWNADDNVVGFFHSLTPHIAEIRAAAKDEGVPLVNLIETFDRPDRIAFFVLLGGPEVEKMWMDNLHFNIYGAQLAATEYAAAIAEWAKRTHPDWTVNEAPIAELRDRLSRTPDASRHEDYWRIPPPALIERITPLMNASNAIHAPPKD